VDESKALAYLDLVTMPVDALLELGLEALSERRRRSENDWGQSKPARDARPYVDLGESTEHHFSLALLDALQTLMRRNAEALSRADKSLEDKLREVAEADEAMMIPIPASLDFGAMNDETLREVGLGTSGELKRRLARLEEIVGGGK
jgi:hypothetical protein